MCRGLCPSAPHEGHFGYSGSRTSSCLSQLSHGNVTWKRGEDVWEHLPNMWCCPWRKMGSWITGTCPSWGGFCSCLSLHDDWQPWLWVLCHCSELLKCAGKWLCATCWCVWERSLPYQGLCCHFCCHHKLLVWTEVGSVTFWFKSVELPFGGQRCVAATEHTWALALLGGFLRWAKKSCLFSFYFFFLPDVLAEPAEFVWLEVCIFLTGKQKKWKI